MSSNRTEESSNREEESSNRKEESSNREEESSNRKEESSNRELVTPAVLCFADYVTDKLSESKSCLLHFYQSSQPNLGLAFVVRMCMTSIPPGTSII